MLERLIVRTTMCLMCLTPYVSVALGGPWKVAPLALTAHGNSLYIVENQTLHQVNPVNGRYRALGGQVWKKAPTALTSHGRLLYIIENQTLYRVSPANGTYQALGGQIWKKAPIALTSYGNSLYVIKN